MKKNGTNKGQQDGERGIERERVCVKRCLPLLSGVHVVAVPIYSYIKEA